MRADIATSIETCTLSHIVKLLNTYGVIVKNKTLMAFDNTFICTVNVPLDCAVS